MLNAPHSNRMNLSTLIEVTSRLPGRWCSIPVQSVHFPSLPGFKSLPALIHGRILSRWFNLWILDGLNRLFDHDNRQLKKYLPAISMYSTVETVGGESAAADVTSDIEAQTIESLLLIHYSFFMFVCVLLPANWEGAKLKVMGAETPPLVVTWRPVKGAGAAKRLRPCKTIKEYAHKYLYTSQPEKREKREESAQYRWNSGSNWVSEFLLSMLVMATLVAEIYWLHSEQQLEWQVNRFGKMAGRFLVFPTLFCFVSSLLLLLLLLLLLFILFLLFLHLKLLPSGLTPAHNVTLCTPFATGLTMASLLSALDPLSSPPSRDAPSRCPFDQSRPNFWLI